MKKPAPVRYKGKNENKNLSQNLYLNYSIKFAKQLNLIKMNPWHPASWQTKPCSQPVSYPDTEALNQVLDTLASQPSLVTVKDILVLKTQLAEAALGQRFLLQGGDCAERFSANNHAVIDGQLAVLQLLKTQLNQLLQKPIICVGRIAGQYTKPRSHDTETQNGLTLPSYRGDMINQHAFTAEARIPNPNRIKQGYDCAASTIACIKKFTQDSIYVSHEALLLPYEQALTRAVVSPNATWYNFSTHFPWCGVRTTHLNSAHIEYLRGIANPIALKIGPDTQPNNLIQLLNTLNPDNEPGRITLIHRFGVNQINTCLKPLIHAVKQQGKIVLWVCDPMHGNTTTTLTGIKIRSMRQILAELQQAFQIHAAEDSYLGGVHLELTSDTVTECIDMDINEIDPNTVPHSELTFVDTALVDPRLNQQQALEVIQSIPTFISAQLAS